MALSVPCDGIGGDAVRQRIAFNIAGRERNHHRCVFRYRRRAVGGDRRVVHRRDGDCDGRDIGVERAVVGPIGERVRAVVVCRWGIGDLIAGIVPSVPYAGLLTIVYVKVCRCRWWRRA